MYPPPRPIPPRTRTGTPAPVVVLIASVCLFVGGAGGCAVGLAAATDPDNGGGLPVAETSRAATPTRKPSTPKATTKPAASTSFGDGTWRVPEDIKPGTYRTTTAEGCYWSRLRGFSGKLADVIANDFTQASTAVVTIKKSDAGFTAKKCGTWTRIGK
ncbi:hypothetical protein GCM10022254_10270 [Actinomadura meridiana]|uniref:Uncharacterized protein n=1 Tax=Actinomadura meridiana TaxID=559626 RepID=A0ABP8BTY6_9ACTN